MTEVRWLATAILAVLAAGAASAQVSPQTRPYESGQRSSIGTGLGQMQLPKGGQFIPRVDAAIQYAANITLAQKGEPETNTAGLELAPGFYASLSNGYFMGAIDYSLIGRVWEDSDFNDVSHRLATNGQWLAIPEWFAIGAQGTYEDGVINPNTGINYGGLGIFGSQNLEERATASVNPVLQHRFNDLEFKADYQYGRVWYLDQGKGQDPGTLIQDRNSIDQNANVSFGMPSDSGSRVYGTLFYDWSRSEYETSIVPYEFERAGLDAGARISRTLWLVGDVGQETDLQKRAATGGLETSFWSAGLRWTPDENTSAEVRYGDRSFGGNWTVDATHRTRRVELNASYSEEPTVETQRLSLGTIDPGQLPPGVSEGDLGIFNSLPYLHKDGRISVGLLGSKTRMDVSVFVDDRDYLAGRNFDENSSGGLFTLTRHLASNLTADFSADYRRYERQNAIETLAPVKYNDADLILRFNRTSSKHLTMSAETGYLQRTGDIEYDGWWVAMRARWTP